ncbi:putative RNA-binding protein [Lipomyces kononenkoae]
MEYENGSRNSYDQPYDDRRSASPGRMDDRPPADDYRESKPEAVNKGDNLFVTGIHPRVTEDELTQIFAKYGVVEKCEIMTDPHSKESRGFGFVKFQEAAQADAARENLQGHEIEGRAFNIEIARRSRARTPTPGKYYGPRKRCEFLYYHRQVQLLIHATADNYRSRRGPRPAYDDRYRREDDRDRRRYSDHYDDRDRDRDRDRYSYDRDRDRDRDRYRDSRDDRYRDMYRERERDRDRDRYSDRDRGYPPSRYGDDYGRSRYDRR